MGGREEGQGRWSWDDGTDNSGGDAAASGEYRGCSGAPCRSEKETGRGGLSLSGVMSVSSVRTHSPSLNSTSAVYSFAATVEITSLSFSFLLCRMNMIRWHLLLSSLSLGPQL